MVAIEPHTTVFVLNSAFAMPLLIGYNFPRKRAIVHTSVASLYLFVGRLGMVLECFTRNIFKVLANDNCQLCNQ